MIDLYRRLIANCFVGLTTQDPNSTGAVTELQLRRVLEQLEIEDDATLVFYDDHLSLVLFAAVVNGIRWIGPDLPP